MPEKHGIVRWPGLPSCISCSYTASHGISPGTATLTTYPVGNPQMYGSLVLSDGSGTVTIPFCKIDSHRVTRDAEGVKWVFQILDRRWKWRFGHVNGVFNQKDPHGLFYQWCFRTERDLVEHCLLAMGETRYTINVPTSINPPPTDWNYSNPAQCLQMLADTLGCRVVYRLDTDGVLITPVGEGAGLPPGSLTQDSPELDPAERPDKITLVGAPIKYQIRIATQAVAEDWDGLYRPLNFVSYAPLDANGLPDWTHSWPGGMGNMTPTDRLTRLQANALANKSAYRVYRILNLNPALGGQLACPIPGREEPLQRVQQLMLEDTKVEQIQPQAPDETILDASGQRIIRDYYDGFTRDEPAKCYGARYVGHDKRGPVAPQVILAPILAGGAAALPDQQIQGTNNTADSARIFVNFSIDAEKYLIHFDQPVFYYNDDRTITPTAVILETGCLIRDSVSNLPIPYVSDLIFPNPVGTLAHIIHHDDVQLNVIGDYNEDNVLIGLRAVSGQGHSAQDTLNRSQYYLFQESRKYQLVGGYTRNYLGIVPIWLDGAIQQVTWTVGGGGPPTTQASYNSEHSPYIPPYPVRLKIEFAPAVARRELGRKPLAQNQDVETMWKWPNGPADPGQGLNAVGPG